MTRRISPYPVRALFAGLLFTAPPALGASRADAQDFGGGEGSGNGGKWEFVLGGGAIYGPTFDGAEDYEAKGFPFFSISYGDRVNVDLGGISVDVYQSGPLSLQTRLGYGFGREEEDDPHLAGLGDIDGGATLGFGLDYSAGPFDLYAEFDKSFGDSDGFVGKFGAEVSRPVGQVLLGAGVSATWADDNQMQSYFGVTSAQSAASGLARYEAAAGFNRVNLELSATYMFAEDWMLRGQIEIGELIGDAAESPVVQDTTQASAGLFVAYRF